MCDQTPGKDQCCLPLTTPPDLSPTSVVFALDKSLGLMSLRALNHSQDSGTCIQLSQLLTHWPCGDVEHSTCAPSTRVTSVATTLPSVEYGDLRESDAPCDREKPELIVLVPVSLAVVKHLDKKNWAEELFCLNDCTPSPREVRAGTPDPSREFLPASY